MEVYLRGNKRLKTRGGYLEGYVNRRQPTKQNNSPTRQDQLSIKVFIV